MKRIANGVPAVAFRRDVVPHATTCGVGTWQGVRSTRTMAHSAKSPIVHDMSPAPSDDAFDDQPHAVTPAPVDHAAIRDAVRQILVAVGEDPDREGLVKTPDRVARAYAELFAGLAEDPRRHLSTVFTAEYDEVVLLRDIPFASVCEHHLLPFTGRCTSRTSRGARSWA